MAMQVTVDPDLLLLFFFDLIHEFLDAKHFWVELWLRINPLPIKINACTGVTVVSNDDAIRIHDWYQYERVKLPQILSFPSI
jgi:hypothetical protein